MPITLRTTLCETRDALHVLRRALFVRGHIDAMEETLASIVNRHGTTNRGPDAVAWTVATR